jgi:DNA-binding transcriptional MerR regulator
MSSHRQQGTAKSPDLMRPSEASRRLGIGPDALRAWCEIRKIPALRNATVVLPSGHRRYRSDVIEAYAKAIGRGAA